MSRCEKILRRARNSPSSLRFEELCQLAECFGFVFDRQSGSHHIFVHSTLKDIMDFQPKNGKAKSYQVKQLLDAIDDLSDLEARGEK